MLWELMKAQRLGIYPDLWTKCVAEAFKNTSSKITEMSGALPLAFVTTGLPLTNYKAYGNAVQAATPSPDNPAEVQAVGERTGNLVSIKPFDSAWGYNSSAVKDVFNTLDIGTYTISFKVKLSKRNDTSDGSTYGIAIINDISGKSKWENWDTSAAGTIKSFSLAFTINDANKGKYTNVYFYGCGINGTGPTGSAQIYDVMLNAGSTALPYEPYGYKIPFTTAAEDGSESITTTVYLDKPLYKIGDYADTLCYAEQKVERYIKELILTGEEDWALQSINEHGIANYFIRFNNAHKVAFKMVCTHFVEQNTMIASTTTEGVFNANGNALYIRVKQERASTATNFKSYLAEQYNNGTPVKIYYVLATPETESVELPKLPTLDGVTVIDAATTIKPSAMDIKYTALNLLTF